MNSDSERSRAGGHGCAEIIGGGESGQRTVRTGKAPESLIIHASIRVYLCLSVVQSNRYCEAGTIRQWVWFALTLALSPGRGKGNESRWEHAPKGLLYHELRIFLPLLGERAGVRESVPFQLNRSG